MDRCADIPLNLPADWSDVIQGGKSSSGSTAASSVRSKNYFCDYDSCGKAFTRPSLLTEHQQTVHQGIKRFQCPQCERQFARQAHLDRHLLSHAADAQKPHHCSVCGKGVVTLQQLKRHEVTHTKSFKCTYDGCTESFYKHPQLRSHILSVHERKLTCELCHKEFQRPYRLKNHMIKHHGEQVYHCTFSGCLQNFKNWTNLQAHIKRDHPKLKCPRCDKYLVGQTGLQNHMKVHDDALVMKNWKCHLCDTSCNRKLELVQHYGEFHASSALPEELLQPIMLPPLVPLPSQPDITIRRRHKSSENKQLESEANLQNFLDKNDSGLLLLNTIGKKYRCPHYKCYRTFKTKEKFYVHLEKHKLHQEKLEQLEQQKQQDP
ncbi:Pzf1p KNAG_0F03980 [Huiozyma naganishii CBS 8797]|uniref:C2H2-type domain-containing protein n=1 Tax=Huiozyma naganishii (strain ATCC MYA-139 / BCRC 22969 / CBS 8797 / KCTC 17520 / NBRC 10181 / NCYC 3082 / Yp74L-3) TaxID=1071383 RepID=J7S0M7_HUIN7|nr:hypothetical protein KNAG_0F03980 [Kazachstania naganishii CBS 8797]CCK71062.1 hypothetical protein KNAG_0F03980 [Kazachstania naganishii CBS 8797]